MAEPAIKHMTLAEFLSWEDGTDTRYELIGGLTMAMAPPARAHRMLFVRLGGMIDAGLRSRWPCSATLRLSSVDLQIAMAELYDGIDIEAENAA
jgi:hypothetical protein